MKKKIIIIGVLSAVALSLASQNPLNNQVTQEVRYNTETEKAVARTSWSYQGGKAYVRVTNPLNEGINDKKSSMIEAAFGGRKEGIVQEVGAYVNIDGSGFGASVRFNGPTIENGNVKVNNDVNVYGNKKKQFVQLNVRPSIAGETLAAGIASGMMPSNVQVNTGVAEGKMELRNVEIQKTFLRKKYGIVSGSFAINKEGKIGTVGTSYGIRF